MGTSDSAAASWSYVNPDSGAEALVYWSSLGDGVVIEVRSHPSGSTANPAMVIRPQDLAEFTGKLREFGDADVIAEAGQVLSGYFTDFDVDPRLLRQILDGHPGLIGQAAEWGWSDTEVREQLAGLLAQALLRRPLPIYGTAAADTSFGDDLRCAHDAWVRTHPAEQSP